MALCGAKTRRGTPCQRAGMANGKCPKHGGKTPRGVASPHFRHGRYSRSLPTQLASRYEMAAADPKLLEMRSEIALIDTHVASLLALLDSGNDNKIWRGVMEAVEQRRKLVETEQRRLVAMQQMITATEAMGMVAMLVAIVRAHVSDAGALAKIAADVDRLVTVAGYE